MRVFIGLDVSLAKTAVCVIDRDGARCCGRRKFRASPARS
jgi:hypothetical protein